jgi:YD repeat-containing protein
LDFFDEGTITGDGENGATAGDAGDNAAACNVPGDDLSCACDRGNAGGMSAPAGGGGSLLNGTLGQGGQVLPAGGMMRPAVQSRIARLALTATRRSPTVRPGPGGALDAHLQPARGRQPPVFGYGNLGPQWTYTGLTCLIDDPNEAGDNVEYYLPGGGTRFFKKADYDPATRTFARDLRDQSVLALVSTNPVRYERRLADGGIETYAHSDGRKAFPRRIFLTQKKDPAGNALTYHYDPQNRLTHLVDASGQKTRLEYRHADPLKITGLVGPAGKRARIDYDERGRLVAVTDAAGLISRVREADTYFDDAVHFFFDDTPLSEGEVKCIGTILENEHEAMLSDSICAKIDVLLETYGCDKPDEFYVRTSEWKEIVRDAKRFLEYLKEPPVFKDYWTKSKGLEGFE